MAGGWWHRTRFHSSGLRWSSSPSPFARHRQRRRRLPLPFPRKMNDERVDASFSRDTRSRPLVHAARRLGRRTRRARRLAVSRLLARPFPAAFPRRDEPRGADGQSPTRRRESAVRGVRLARDRPAGAFRRGEPVFLSARPRGNGALGHYRDLPGYRLLASLFEVSSSRI